MRPVIGLAICLLGAACAGSGPYAPYQEFHNGGDQPIAASPREVWAYATQAVRARGGLPPDAILTEISGERAISADAKSPAAGHQMSYIYVWRAPVIGADDRIMLMIASGESKHCTQRDCSAYDVTYGLYVQMFTRKWVPAPQRERDQRTLQDNLTPGPLPSYVSSSCPGGRVNVPALRRVVAALGEHADSLGMYHPIVEADVLKSAAWVYARFPAFTIHRVDPLLHKAESIDVRGAAVGDVPGAGQRFIEILSRESSSFARLQDVWLQFIDTDFEPVCANPPVAHAVRPSSSDRGLSSDEMPYDAVDRSLDEAMWTRNSFKNSPPEVVSKNTSPDGTLIVTSIQQNDGEIWRGAFSYDSNGVLRRSTFSRLT